MFAKCELPHAPHDNLSRIRRGNSLGLPLQHVRFRPELAIETNTIHTNNLNIVARMVPSKKSYLEVADREWPKRYLQLWPWAVASPFLSLLLVSPPRLHSQRLKQEICFETDAYPA